MSSPEQLEALERVDPERRAEVLLVLTAHEAASEGVCGALRSLGAVHPSLNHVMNGDVFEHLRDAIADLQSVEDHLAWCGVHWYGAKENPPVRGEDE